MNGHAILIDNARVLTLEGPPGPGQDPGTVNLAHRTGMGLPEMAPSKRWARGKPLRWKCTRGNLSGGRRLRLGAHANLDRLPHPRVLDGQREPHSRVVGTPQRTLLSGDPGVAGIMSTVRSVREASMTELSDAFLHRLTAMISWARARSKSKRDTGWSESGTENDACSTGPPLKSAANFSPCGCKAPFLARTP